MKRDVIVFGLEAGRRTSMKKFMDRSWTQALLIAIIIALGWVFAYAGSDPPPTQLTQQPVRIIPGQQYVAEVPPASTGISVQLVLVDGDPEYDCYTDVAGDMVTTHPKMPTALDLQPGDETTYVQVSRHVFPWSGFSGGVAWGYLIVTQPDAVQHLSVAVQDGHPALGIRRSNGRVVRSVVRVPRD